MFISSASEHKKYVMSDYDRAIKDVYKMIGRNCYIEQKGYLYVVNMTHVRSGKHGGLKIIIYYKNINEKFEILSDEIHKFIYKITTRYAIL